MIESSGVNNVTSGEGYSLFLKNDGSLWGTGGNNYGQLGDGTTINQNSPVQIQSAAQMNPQVLTLGVIGGMGGSVSGDGTYDSNQSVNAIAIPDSGFVFGGWSGDLTSSDANFSLTMNGNYELNASFYQEAHTKCTGRPWKLWIVHGGGEERLV